MGPKLRAHTLLGPGTPAFEAAVVVLDAVFEAAHVHDPPLRWPTTAQELRDFVEGVVRLARTIRSGKGPGPGFQGGASLAHMYCVQHFTRSMLLAATHATPGLLDGLTMGDLRGWLPDERDLLRPLDTWSCRDVSEAFATSPLFLAAWGLPHPPGRG